MALKSRRSSNPLRTLWMARKLIAAAIVLGILLWFILMNHQEVTLYFPFGMGQARSSLGVVVLLSALAGGAVTALLSAFFWARKWYRPGSRPHDEAAPGESEHPSTSNHVSSLREPSSVPAKRGRILL